MDNMIRAHIEKTFAGYAADYNADDPKIALKIKHTYKVAKMAEEIALSICGCSGCGDVDADLAWVCGMLHDIGRFEQVARFGTFSDADSVDHAQLGADLLFKEDLIRDFFPDEKWLSHERRSLLELAVRCHSLYNLPAGLTDREIMYCNILRDADKVDIFRVNTETPLEDIYNVSTYDLKNSLISEEVKQCFVERHTVLRAYKKTPVDFIVGHICLAFGLVYSKSRDLARGQGFLDKLLSFESGEPETREFFIYMREHVWEKTGS